MAVAGSPAPTQAFSALVDALAGDLDLLAERCAARFTAELASYAALTRDELLPVLHANYATLLAQLAQGRQPAGEEDHAPYRESGEIRAAQGVSAGDMLQGWRIGLATLRERALEIVVDDEHRDAVLLELLDLALLWTDVGMVGSAAGHRQAELEVLRTEQHQRANLVRGLLHGGVPPSELRAAAEAFGLDPAASYHAIRARPTDGAGLRRVEAFLDLGDSAGPRNGLVALIDGDVCGFAARLPRRAAPVAIGVAGPVAMHDLGGAFRRAGRALETVLALGVPGMFSLADLGLQPAVLADPAVGEHLTQRFVTPLERAGTPGRVILETVDRYLANDGRLEVTAGELCVHVNTVRYRLNRFEELTSCSLRSTEDLVAVWWALARRRLTKT